MRSRASSSRRSLLGRLEETAVGEQQQQQRRTRRSVMSRSLSRAVATAGSRSLRSVLLVSWLDSACANLQRMHGCFACDGVRPVAARCIVAGLNSDPESPRAPRGSHTHICCRLCGGEGLAHTMRRYTNFERTCENGVRKSTWVHAIAKTEMLHMRPCGCAP